MDQQWHGAHSQRQARPHNGGLSSQAHFYGPVTYVERSENLFLGANYGSVNQVVHGDAPPGTHLDPSRFLLEASIPDASHLRDPVASPPNSRCLPGTRKAIVQEFVAWIEDPTFAAPPNNDNFYHPGLPRKGIQLVESSVPQPPTLSKQRHVAWLVGPPGCGKSAVSQTVAEEAERRGCLAATFFFHHESESRSKFNRVAITLASQLVSAVPSTKHHIEAAIRASPNLDRMSVSTQFDRLIYRPLEAAVGSGALPTVKRRSPAGWLANYVKPLLIIIDGLDQCVDGDDVQDFIEHMLESFAKKRTPRIPLRILVSSGNKDHIRETFDMDQVATLDLGKQDYQEDMKALIRHTFNTAAKRDKLIRSYGEGWPPENDVNLLIERSGGSFTFVAAVLDSVLGRGPSGCDGSTPMQRFDLALTTNVGLLQH